MLLSWSEWGKVEGHRRTGRELGRPPKKERAAAALASSATLSCGLATEEEWTDEGLDVPSCGGRRNLHACAGGWCDEAAVGFCWREEERRDQLRAAACPRSCWKSLCMCVGVGVEG